MAEGAAERAALYVAAALAFGVGVWLVAGPTAGSEFFAGYLLEQSLSVDNLFVFVLIFKYFKTPVEGQQKVLFWGILTAGVLRAVCVLLGAELIQVFEPVLLVFAAILLLSSYKLLAGNDDSDDSDDLSDNAVVRICRRFIPCSNTYDGDRFVSEVDGARVLTPLVLVLAVVELSDVVFAVDSIPAVFGVTLNPFIVYTSNMFAILSLRAFYAFVAVFLESLRFLDKAIALVLGFVGVKIILDYAGFQMPTWAALVVVAGTLSGGVGLSLLYPAAPQLDGGAGTDEVAAGAQSTQGKDSSGRASKKE